jgi:hypothetical protein
MPFDSYEVLEEKCCLHLQGKRENVAFRRRQLCETYDFYGGDHEGYCLLGCDAVPSGSCLPNFGV